MAKKTPSLLVSNRETFSWRGCDPQGSASADTSNVNFSGIESWRPSVLTLLGSLYLSSNAQSVNRRKSYSKFCAAGMVEMGPEWELRGCCPTPCSASMQIRKRKTRRPRSLPSLLGGSGLGGRTQLHQHKEAREVLQTSQMPYSGVAKNLRPGVGLAYLIFREGERVNVDGRGRLHSGKAKGRGGEFVSSVSDSY